MRIVLGLMLIAHGIAHLPGFLVNLRLQSFEALPYRTTVLGGSVDVGDAGTKVLAVAWVALTLAFGALGVSAITGRLLWQPYGIIGLSIVLCLLGWPDSRLGVAANVVVLCVVVFVNQ